MLSLAIIIKSKSHEQQPWQMKQETNNHSSCAKHKAYELYEGVTVCYSTVEIKSIYGLHFFLLQIDYYNKRHDPS